MPVSDRDTFERVADRRSSKSRAAVTRRHSKSRVRTGQSRSRRLLLEPLEDRQLLTVVAFNPTKDNTLFEDKAGTVSNGAGDSIALGTDHRHATSMRGLAAFDVAKNIPADSTINSVTLTVWVNYNYTTDTPNIELHKVLADWGEGVSQAGWMPPYAAAQPGDATWLHAFYPNTLWTNPGGDYSPTVSGVRALGPSDGSYTWASNSQMVADVQGWLDNPTADFGWLLQGDETQESGKMIDTRESTTASHRPTLTVDYTAPAASPSISLSDVQFAAEGNNGTTVATFNVMLSAASSQTVTVNYATADGTAMAGTDYVAASGQVTFAPNETTRPIEVIVNGDTLVELNETFLVNLSGATNATIADAQGVCTITNDDGSNVDNSTLTIDDVTVVEGNSGTTNVEFTVTLHAAVGATRSNEVTVDYTTTDGSAHSASDFTFKAGTLSFSPTETKQTITIEVQGDQVVEADEYFQVELSNATNATLSDSQGLATITNDDNLALSTLSISDSHVVEGNEGTRIITFTVTLDVATNGPVSVDFATMDGTATGGAGGGGGGGDSDDDEEGEGDDGDKADDDGGGDRHNVSDVEDDDGNRDGARGDYVTTNGTLQFSGQAGETQTVQILVNGDKIREIDETFFLDLSNPMGAAIGTGRGIGTILDDDSGTNSDGDSDSDSDSGSDSDGGSGSDSGSDSDGGSGSDSSSGHKRWHNTPRPLDVNDDRAISPLDALLVINRLNSGGGDGVLPFLPDLIPYFYDVSGDDRCSPLDALMVINDLNRGEGEGVVPAQIPALGTATGDTAVTTQRASVVTAAEDSHGDAFEHGDRISQKAQPQPWSGADVSSVVGGELKHEVMRRRRDANSDYEEGDDAHTALQDVLDVIAQDVATSWKHSRSQTLRVSRS